MQFIPKSVLSKLYNRTSLRNENGFVTFSVKNRLSPSTLLEISQVSIDGHAVAPERISLSVESNEAVPVSSISPASPVDFPLGTLVHFFLQIEPMAEGTHDISMSFDAHPFGRLNLEVQDALKTGKRAPGAVPRDSSDDYSEAIIRTRQEFIGEQTGADLKHIASYSFDPHVTQGNIEHFTGVAQVPLGFAGPLLVHGEHAQGEFYVPLACSEGTLVASYNRGMKVLHRSGGVKCAVVGDNMQRAPVFIFEDAASARRFIDWLVENTGEIKIAADATDPFVKMDYIDHYLAAKFAYLRFNFKTGDAAGMNMVGKATFAACNWILEHCDTVEIQRFFLESNFATDKKSSMINMLKTRGKRVVAEAVVKRDVLLEIMDADTESIYYHGKVANMGSMLSGANNNGCHAANAITAMFLATGQDVANVSESSMGLLYSELTPERDLYLSITLPSLIVATCGGGTGLPTQRESLEALGCYGVGKVLKFAEIVAGTVLAGEISLAAAISSLDWVSSHDRFGRNDPRAAS
ncbi:MAG: hydroxymethylglutaryl-CoA reductase [Xanthomonadales bacterium]|nr:hydroxymethylglutaryl-CoA reductase [Gammaproteobacteria bacterium]MBT8054602.1 hydroxymethylglutaryl-CoA reductase [Gammaproteobacteria bacterium]NND58104.1 hydroxymethylglutaryl-CoA reductase [Xanthomonadales bacterium]NNK50377.1 hydroxymethylglutaryl-CoA reductase [Xanthomonadales bacterium]